MKVVYSLALVLHKVSYRNQIKQEPCCSPIEPKLFCIFIRKHCADN